MNSIRETSRSIREQLAVVQTLAVGGDVETVDGGRVGLVVLAGEGVDARVGDVDVFEIGAVTGWGLLEWVDFPSEFAVVAIGGTLHT